MHNKVEASVLHVLCQSFDILDADFPFEIVVFKVVQVLICDEKGSRLPYPKPVLLHERASEHNVFAFFELSHDFGR